MKPKLLEKTAKRDHSRLFSNDFRLFCVCDFVSVVWLKNEDTTIRPPVIKTDAFLIYS